MRVRATLWQTKTDDAMIKAYPPSSLSASLCGPRWIGGLRGAQPAQQLFAVRAAGHRSWVGPAGGGVQDGGAVPRCVLVFFAFRLSFYRRRRRCISVYRFATNASRYSVHARFTSFQNENIKTTIQSPIVQNHTFRPFFRLLFRVDVTATASDLSVRTGRRGGRPSHRYRENAAVLLLQCIAITAMQLQFRRLTFARRILYYVTIIVVTITLFAINQ